MANVLLVIQLIISIVLTFLILIQRSEGGALGIGGGGGGGLMSGRSATNSITRFTAILGAAFIVNCMVLSVVFNNENQSQSIIDVEGAQAPLTIDTETADKANPLDDAIAAPETVSPDTALETAPVATGDAEVVESEDPKLAKDE